jgi:hypothetical protein
LLVVLAVLAALMVMSVPRDLVPTRVEVPPRVPSRIATESELLHRGPTVTTPQLASLSVVPLAGGRLLAGWVGFPRGAANEGEVTLSTFDARQWSVPQVVLRSEELARLTGSPLANIQGAVVHVDRSGFVHLFIASRILGELSWTGIEHLRSADGGQRFVHLQRLRLAPLLNGSYRVGAPGINLRGGGFVLPVHYAWGANYGVLLRFDAKGRFLAQTRIDGPPRLADPWPVVHSENLVEFYLREVAGDRRLWVGRLDRSEPVRPLNLRQGTPGLAALPSFDGTSWIARVPEQAPEQLVLQRVNALHQTTETLPVAKGLHPGGFSDPRLAQTDDNRLHLLYLDRGQRIGHRVFRATGL